jgi:prevent-host-death family protein
MEETVSAAEANRRFSLLLRGVREGHTYIVTSHGKAVARIVPARQAVAKRARDLLLTRLEKLPIVNVGRWSRDELYDDDA